MGAKCCPCCKKDPGSSGKVPTLDATGSESPANRALPPVPDPTTFVKLSHVVCQVVQRAELDNYKCVLMFSEPHITAHTTMQKNVLKNFPNIEEEVKGSLLTVKRSEKKMTVVIGLVDAVENLHQCLEAAITKLEETAGETLVLLEKESLESDILAPEDSYKEFAKVFVEFCKKVQTPRIIDILTNTEHNLTQMLRLAMCR